MQRFSSLLLAFLMTFIGLSFQIYAADPKSDSMDPTDAHSWRYEEGSLILDHTQAPLLDKPVHPNATLQGIDVSVHQGTINWAAVKKSGIDFAILRCGFGMDQTDQDDLQFAYNASECERLGIPYGVYIYSYATNTMRAESEADHVLRLINGRKLSFPVYFDMEDDTTLEADHAAIASAFCSRITEAGYPVGVYANLYWWNTYLTDPCFDSWHRWVAQYNDSCGYTGTYDMWQYTDSGTVKGISGKVDMNYLIGSPADHGTGTTQHQYSHVTTAPTCTEPGHTAYTCSICGNSYNGSDLQPLGHSWDDGVVIRQPARDEAGIRLHTCEVCNATKETAIAWSVYRIAGNSRSETALAAADALKEVFQKEKFDSIILASGNGFADALAGSHLAAIKNAPILLHRESAMEINRDYIFANLAEGGTVYILGGTAAVSQEMENALAGLRVQRLFGSSRFDTNLKILEAASVHSGEILVTTGYNFADSLSASATGLPILMVNNDTGILTDAQRAFLAGLENCTFTIIGGNAAVSDDLANSLLPFGTVKRVFGSSREETSIQVAEKYFPEPQRILLAYSWDFPDGLCGGPLARAMGSPLLLASSGSETPAASHVSRYGILEGYILGGTAVVSDDTADIIFGTHMSQEP